MTDGSICHELATSSPEGVDVVNQQCGGAVSVEFTLPEDSKFGECDLNLHEVSFDCSHGEKPPGQLPPPGEKPHVSTNTIASSTSSLEPKPTPVTSTMTEPVFTPKVSTEWTTQEFTVTNCPPTVTDCPEHSTVTSTYTTSSTFWPSSSASVTPSLVSSTTPATPDSSIVPAPCPGVVPKCINTWLSIPKCDSNSDAACFCPSSEFTSKVEDCIHAWAKSDQEKDSALSYFAGICAPYVPQNPGLIEIVPTSSWPASQTSQPTGPAHVMTTAVTITPTTTGSHHTTPCTTVTWSSQTVTVPEVTFSTISMGSTTSVCLVAATVTPTTSSSPAKTSCSSFKTITTVVPCACETTGTTTTTSSSPSGTPPHSNAGSKSFTNNALSVGVALLILNFL